MFFKTPRFWTEDTRSARLWSTALSVFSPLYKGLHSFVQGRKVTFIAGCPVICVGNASVGGTGKTPVCDSLMAILQKNGLVQKPCFLTRGFGGTLRRAVLDARHGFTADQVGDEALILAQCAPVIVARDRQEGAMMAVEKGFDCLVMDDGLQNASLAKDLSFVVIDGANGFGNGKTLPAGPLREPLERVFAKTDAFIVMGQDKSEVSKLLPSDKPVFYGQVRAVHSDDVCGRKFVAFAGIGRPQKFFDTLISAGANVLGGYKFADHRPYTQSDMQALHRKAKAQGAALITTQKDMMRLRAAGLDGGVESLDIALHWEDEPALSLFLEKSLKALKK